MVNITVYIRNFPSVSNKCLMITTVLGSPNPLLLLYQVYFLYCNVRHLIVNVAIRNTGLTELTIIVTCEMPALCNLPYHLFIEALLYYIKCKNPKCLATFAYFRHLFTRDAFNFFQYKPSKLSFFVFQLNAMLDHWRC